MTRWAVVAPALALVSTGCLASKSDIRLLQDELRANRSQLGVVDTSIIRTNEQRRQQIASLSAAIDRMNDSLRVLAARFGGSEQDRVLDGFGRLGYRADLMADHVHLAPDLGDPQTRREPVGLHLHE